MNYIQVIDKSLLPITELKLGGNRYGGAIRFKVSHLQCSQRQTGASHVITQFTHLQVLI